MIVWNYLMHYGIPRKSGRYAWGSGENPYHHGQSAPWRVRRNIKKYDKLKSKLDKNQSEQDKYNAKLNGYFKSRAQSKAAAAEEKAAGLEKRVYKANKKLQEGKELSRRQEKALEKYDKYNDRADKYNAQTAKERARIKSLETAEKRLIDKMNKIDDKLLNTYTTKIKEYKIKEGRRIVEENKQLFQKKGWDLYNKDSFNYAHKTVKLGNNKSVKLVVDSDATKLPKPRSKKFETFIKNNIKTINKTAINEILKDKDAIYNDKYKDRLDLEYIHRSSLNPNYIVLQYHNKYDGHIPTIEYDIKKKRIVKGTYSYDG